MGKNPSKKKTKKIKMITSKKNESVRNGMLFGAILGLAVLVIIDNVDTFAFLSFISSFLTYISTWLIGLPSWPEIISSVTFMNYTLSAVFGAALGLYIDLN